MERTDRYNQVFDAVVGYYAADPQTLHHKAAFRLHPQTSADEVAFCRARLVADTVDRGFESLADKSDAWWLTFCSVMGPIAVSAEVAQQKDQVGMILKRAYALADRRHTVVSNAPGASEFMQPVQLGHQITNVSPNGSPSIEHSPNNPNTQLQSHASATPLSSSLSPQRAQPTGWVPPLSSAPLGPNPPPFGAPPAVGGPYGLPGSPQGGFAPSFAPPGLGVLGVPGLPGAMDGVALPGAVAPDSPNKPANAQAAGLVSPNLPPAGPAGPFAGPSMGMGAPGMVPGLM